MTQLTLMTGETIEVNLNHLVYISGVSQGNYTGYHGKKIYLDEASAQILRDDINRRCEEYGRKQELREIIWAS